MYFLLKCILVIASVKLPNDGAQVDASRYDSERGGAASVLCVTLYALSVLLTQSMEGLGLWLGRLKLR